jgi:hypothetical protein
MEFTSLMDKDPRARRLSNNALNLLISPLAYKRSARRIRQRDASRGSFAVF